MLFHYPFNLPVSKAFFANKLSALRTGAIHRTTAFAVKVILTNDIEENYTMLLGTATLAFAITATPNYQIIEKDLLSCIKKQREGQESKNKATFNRGWLV